MTKQWTKGILGLVALCVAALAVFAVSAPAVAAVDCTAIVAGNDGDGDGFLDSEECAGITLPAGMALYTQATALPRCTGGEVRDTCIDPNSREVFVLLVRANPTWITMPSPLEFLARPIAAGGLGIVAHEILLTNPALGSRSITASQMAVRVTESLDATGTTLGVSNQGTPNGLDLATIYTARIRNFVDTTCNGMNCKNVSGETGEALKTLYIKHTLSHEIGHVVSLAAQYNTRFGGYHYKSGTNVVMDQSVAYTKSGTNITFQIPSTWPATDQSAAKLR